MSKSTAQRQADYRNKIAGTYKRVEIILDEAIYKKLQTLVQQSNYRTRIEYMTALIEKEYQLLSGNDQKKPASCKRPTKKKPRKPIEIWQGEKHCQSQTARGTRCRIKHHLSVIPYKSGKKAYEVFACKQHINRFTLHKSLLK